VEIDMNIQQELHQDDEINLYDLWLTLKKRWMIILVVTLVSTGFAFSYAFLTTKVYRVHNILISSQMQEWGFISQGEMAAAVSVLDKLNKLTDLEKDKVLGLLGMHERDFKVIKDIKTSEIKGSSALWVDIDTYDQRKGVALMEALPGFILTNPNIANKIKIQMALMQKNREALKDIIDNPTRSLKLSRNAVVYLPSIDLYALQEKYILINTQIEKMERGQLVSLAWKTEQPIVPYGTKRGMSILIGLVMGCFLGIFIAFFMEWVTKERNMHSNDPE
jgi:LPS O-antigen subunit length determinant protein (WzzB/FepE family)